MAREYVVNGVLVNETNTTREFILNGVLVNEITTAISCPATVWGDAIEGDLTSNASTDMLNTGTIVTPPACVSQGDLMIAFLGLTSVQNHVYAAVAGWELLFTQVDFAGTNFTTAIYYRYAGASEGDVTFKTGSAVDSPPNFGVILAFPGGDPATALDVTYVEADHHTEKTNNATPNITPHDPITTNSDDALVVCFAHPNGDATLLTTAAASGYAIVSSSITDATRSYIIQTKKVTSAGVETPGAAAWTSDSALGDTGFFTIALKPIAGGEPHAYIPVLVRRRGRS